MDINLAVLLGLVGIFGVLTMAVLRFVKRFKGLTLLDAVSRAAAGGVCITGVLVVLFVLYVAVYNLVNVPSDSFPFSVVLILCLAFLIITAGPAVVCVWLAAKWLLRPVRSIERQRQCR